MSHTVEVSSFGGDFAAATSNMRAWLDHHRSQPLLFQQLSGREGVALLLEFASDREAVAFIGAFGGRLLRSGPEASAA